MICRQSRFRERDDVDGRVPHRRKARLNSKIFRVVDKEAFEIFRRFLINRIVRGIAQRAQRDQTIQHRRKNSGETVTAFADALQHPTLRFLQCAFAHGTESKRMNQFQKIIDAQKQIAPGPETLAARQTEILVLSAERIELVQLFHARQFARRLEMIDDRERDQHRPAPGRHFVNVKRRPLRQQNHFHRNRRQILPGKLTEQREVKFAEGVHARNTAEAHDVGARLTHERHVG